MLQKVIWGKIKETRKDRETICQQSTVNTRQRSWEGLIPPGFKKPSQIFLTMSSPLPQTLPLSLQRVTDQNLAATNRTKGRKVTRPRGQINTSIIINILISCPKKRLESKTSHMFHRAIRTRQQIGMLLHEAEERMAHASDQVFTSPVSLGGGDDWTHHSLQINLRNCTYASKFQISG